MINEKKQIIEMVNSLPENTSIDEAIYTLYINSKLEKSKEDIKNKRIMTIEESKELMRNKHEGFDF